MILGLDFETYSDVDLDIGPDAYAAHPSTGVHCAVAILHGPDGERVLRWTPKHPVPRWFSDALISSRVLAHNAWFELSMLRHVLCPRYGWPVPKPDRWRDTAAEAARLSLPSSLHGLAMSLKAGEHKDDEGAELVKKTCKDAAISPDDLSRLMAYCEQDVRTMLACYRMLPPCPTDEHLLQVADREINLRGVHVDLAFADRIREFAKRRHDHLIGEVAKATDCNAFTTAASPIKRYFIDRGIAVPGDKLDRQTGHEMLQTEQPEDVRRVLELRQEAGRVTSLSKLARLAYSVDPQGRLRGVLRYCGAHTGRWSSSGVQVHNLPRSRLSVDELAAVVNAIAKDDYEVVCAIRSNVLESLSMALRSAFTAAPGHDLIGGDFSAIEARVLAWLAGQDDVLTMFRENKDVYTEVAARIGSTDRQLGKVCQLALGYGMGAIKFADTAQTYGITLSLARARDIQQRWRLVNRSIVQFWHELEDACHAVVEKPGERTVGRIRVIGTRSCMRLKLPSGRDLHYWRPKLATVTRKIETVNDQGERVTNEAVLTELRFFREGKDRKSMQVDSVYGGALVENVTQAIARDLLGAALVRLRDTEYNVVLHVHDSIASEVPCGVGSREEFGALMAACPAWASGLPLKVDTYRAHRFKG